MGNKLFFRQTLEPTIVVRITWNIQRENRVQNKRRKLILGGGVLACGATLGGLSRMVCSARQSAEAEVGELIARYGTLIKQRRPGEGKIEYIVKVHELSDFVETFNSSRPHPFERIYVPAGNTMQISHRGTEFTIVNVV
jgi:hypothetical protein